MYSRASRSPAVTKSSTLYYPIWLAYAAGWLQKNGHRVRLVDAPAFDITREELVAALAAERPDLIAVDTTTGSIFSDLAVAEEIKTKTGGFVVLVGTHASATAAWCLENAPSVDAVARGEYDEILRGLVEALERKAPLASVPGLTWRAANGNIQSSADAAKMDNLDDIPFVSQVYKEFLSERIERYFYGANRHPVMAIVTGRGCPYQCCYCVYPQVMHGHRYRYRSVGNVVDEIEYIQREFPSVREIFLEDDTLTVNRSRVFELCEEILRRGINVTWSTNSRAQADYETLRMMKRAGCRLLCVGFESGDQTVLDRLGKKLRVEEILEFSKNARMAGILIHGCFLVGNPGETRESLEKTLAMAKRINPDTAQFYPIMVYPGTRAYEWAKSNGYLLTEDYSKWLTPEGLHYSVVSTPELTREALVQWADRARREFYLRPGFIASKILQSLRHPSEFTRLLRGFRSLVRFIFQPKAAEGGACSCEKH